jgi:hypothetical protein
MAKPWRWIDIGIAADLPSRAEFAGDRRLQPDPAPSKAQPRLLFCKWIKLRRRIRRD